MSEIKKLSVEAIQDVENIIGYTFTNKELLNQAFTRSTYANENKEAVSNEILEFYGDRALDITVTQELSKRLGYIDNSKIYQTKKINEYEEINEGYLTMLRSELVCKTYLARRIESLNLDNYLITGKGDTDHSDSIKEDLFEAICGAMAIDSNWNLEKLNAIILKFLRFEDKYKEAIAPNPKIKHLIEWYKKKFHKDINFYYSTATFGDSDDHTTWNECPECSFAIVKPGDVKEDYEYVGDYDYKFNFTGFGDTNFEARNNALLEAANKLFEEGLVYELFPDNDLDLFKQSWINPTLDNAVNILQEIEQAKIIKDVNYDLVVERNDDDGNPIWKGTCSCMYVSVFKENWKDTCSVSNSFKNKTDAKKAAALSLIEKILEVFHIRKASI